MINQHDSRLNLSMAADSRQVAIASKRDSSAMKTIAVLTIAFLPCTAVAAIFSMDPFMSLSPDGKIEISPMFWLYWTISIPLTIGVIAIWILWLWNKKYFEMKEDRKGEQQVLGASWKVNADSRPIVRGLTEEEKSITPLARRRGRSAGWGRLVRFKSSS